MGNPLKLAGVAAGLLVAGGVWAAEPVGELQQLDGTVMVNQGQDYRDGREGMALREGDRVMVLEGSEAVVVHNGGCVSQVDQNAIFTVERLSSCEAQQAVKKVGPHYAALGNGGNGGNGDSAPAQPGTPSPADIQALLAGAGLGATITVEDALDDDERSPQ